MAYIRPFHRIVIIGTQYTDVFNVTLSMGSNIAPPIPPATQQLADAVRVWVADWWNNATNFDPPAGPGFSSKTILTSVKVNRIGTDGKYMDPDAIEATGTPVPGSTGGFSPVPQLTLAATLRGPNERAKAGKGRMFFPSNEFLTGSNLDATGRLSTQLAHNWAASVVTLLRGINDVYIAEDVNAVAGIASRAGAGAFQPVERVTVGRVIDTMRSRRNKLVEDPQEIAV